MFISRTGFFTKIFPLLTFYIEMCLFLLWINQLNEVLWFFFILNISDAWLSNITYYVYSLPNAEQHLDKDSAVFQEFQTSFCNDVSFINVKKRSGKFIVHRCNLNYLILVNFINKNHIFSITLICEANIWNQFT